jgi:hypothetical protein
MAYIDVAAMLEDDVLTGRIKGCVLEQSRIKDVTTDTLAAYALAQPESATVQFTYFFGGDQAIVGEYATGGQAAVTDGAILSKVQAEWENVKYVLHLEA